MTRAVRRVGGPRGFVLRCLAAYLLCRAFSVVLLVVVSTRQVPMPVWTGPHVDYLSMTVLWDGSWYREIAQHGYPVPLPTSGGQLQQNAWAFYPLFPLLARAVMRTTGAGFPVVGSTIALLSGVAAAGVMGVLLRRRVGERGALAAVAVWGSYAASPTLQIAYTEAPAILLLCLFLLALQHERWLLAAAPALLMGVTRPIAVPMLAVAAVALVLRWRSRLLRPLSGGEAARGLTLLVACALAGLMWPAYAWARTGSPTAYTDTMATWRVGGRVRAFAPWLDMSRYAAGDIFGWGVSPLVGPVGLALLAIALLVVVLGPWAAALGAELRTWCLAYPLYLGAVLEPYTSLFRYLLPLFPLAVVAAGAGWRARSPRRLPLRTGLWVAFGLVTQVWWVWSLLRFEPPSDFPP